MVKTEETIGRMNTTLALVCMKVLLTIVQGKLVLISCESLRRQQAFLYNGRFHTACLRLTDRTHVKESCHYR